MSPTPSSNAILPHRIGGFESLAAGLDYAAQGQTGCNFFSARGELEQTLPYRDLRERAVGLALRLDGLGLPRGTRIAIVADTTPEFLVFFFACQYAGLVPVPLPLSVNFGGRAAYEERLSGMIRTARARAAVASADLIDALRNAAAGSTAALVGTLDEFRGLPSSRGDLRPLSADEPCYIQYSSGSTSFPRGVLVSQRAVASNASAIARHGLQLSSSDRCVSWLPLYHDMGLVGCCLTPVMTQTSIDYIPTTGFARRPLTWLKVMSEQGGTISFSPTFGYELCVRRSANGLSQSFDLSRWRVAGVGGEMIRVRALEQFAERFAASGFRSKAFVPSYGLAEATLAVTFSELGRGVGVDWVNCGPAFERGRKALAVVPRAGLDTTRVRPFATCGRPMPGYRIEIRGDAGHPLPERTVGRVCLQGPSLMTGYFRDLQATRTVITEDGWLDTGDMGYLVDGELVITGRSKDLIIFSGRNIWPQDLEWAVEKLDGVRPGEVAAFSVNTDDDQERVVVIVECRIGDPASRRALRHAVKATVQKVASVECDVVLAAPRSLTFTTSGK
ncbi:MAG TPA: fatty acyl-AMP ligase, partial [Geminicoccaceae bacterium]|nr:fatty acyl-AMP ligase [Geminicoccaceae bacterium]